MKPGRGAGTLEILNLNRACSGMLRDLSKRIERIASGKSNKNDVHRFRTGARRIEAGLTELLQADSRSSPCHDVYKLTRKARKLAGDVRDIDVARELIQKVVAPLENDSQAASAFLDEYLESRRSDALNELERALARRRIANLPKKLQNAFKKEALSRTQIKRVLRRCIARAKTLASASGSPDGLHRTRLCVKRIRDVARIVEPLIGRPAASIATRAARLSEHLGRTQDLAVIVQLIDQVDQVHASSSAMPQLAALRERLVRRQDSSHRSSVLYLADLKAIGRLVSSIAGKNAITKKLLADEKVHLPQ